MAQHIEERLDEAERTIRALRFQLAQHEDLTKSRLARLERSALRKVIGGERAYDEHAEPTYISGSSDRVYALATMPTRYIRNVLGMPDMRVAAGIRREMESELARRNARGQE